MNVLKLSLIDHTSSLGTCLSLAKSDPLIVGSERLRSEQKETKEC